MPIVPTYPGVYIQEIPSGVHTITGVATSIAAFVGYTEQGPMDPVEIFSMADYERAFGGLTVDSPLSYAVNQFFQNGGSQAYVVRVASGASSAAITLVASDGATQVITVTAASDGTWGNSVQLDVDYNTINPQSRFNLRVTQFTMNPSGQMVPGTGETYRNLSMSNLSSNYFLTTINGLSNLITVALDLPSSTVYPKGTSTSGALSFIPLQTNNWANANHLSVSVDGASPIEFVFDTSSFAAAGTLAAILTNIVTSLQNALNSVFGAGAPAVTDNAGAGTITITSNTTTQSSSIRVVPSSVNDAAPILQLGLSNGGTEVEGAAKFRPVQNGSLGGVLTPPLALKATASMNIDVKQPGITLNGATAITLPLWPAAAPTTLDDLVAAINAAFAGSTNPLLMGSTAEIDTMADGDHLRIIPGYAAPNTWFHFSDNGADTTAADIKLSTATANVNHYVLGSGSGTVPFAAAPVSGANGVAPTSLADYGFQLTKTGMYGLENVDLFNIMCMPDVADNPGLASVYPQAVAYCQLRRAMLILDLPSSVLTVADAQKWLNNLDSGLISSYAAAYFPRIQGMDPLLNNVVHQFPNCGAIAGIWAQTDGARGVWKAPAGTETQIAGATGLTFRMNNQDNGVLNPLGLNCLRTFPVYQTVVWGARTMRGADALDDDYKYIPVRRLALFLEESLYRGTQWVVFEPNDEPLWAQIRLTVGSFMHSMYRQGAFAGQTPKVAYFVKCDDETTTPLDQDQGRVNIIVGFAPLNPAEFVIIQIQQIVTVGPA
jgi:phage tail sheath protein FI